jgi:uncharacterized membrane protein (UPF0127 family)
MRQITVENKTRTLSQPIRAKYCASFMCQLRGLTFHRTLNIQEGLLLVQKRESVVDSSIHMLAVGMELAVIWIDSRLNVVDVRLARPWRPVYVPQKPARYVLEISASRLGDFQPGDQVEFCDLAYS